MSSKLKLTGTGGGDTIIQGNDSITTDQTFTFPDNGGEIVTAPAGGSVVGYQQGTWNPQVDFGVSGTTSINNDVIPPTWTRVGNRVDVQAYITLTAKGTGLSGNEPMLIVNLPYYSPGYSSGSVAFAGDFQGSLTFYGITVEKESSQLLMRCIQSPGSSGGIVQVISSLTTNNSKLIFQASYVTDDTTWTPINGATVT